MSLFKKLFDKRQSDVIDIHSLVKQLKKDSSQHEGVGDPLTEQQIEAFEKKIGLQAPPSFVVFLRQFGNGAYWLYGCQPMDSTNNPFWLRDLRPDAPSMIPLDGSDPVAKDSLLCLMTEDSNGGSWCWLTSEGSAKDEWPLAYYEFMGEKLFYRVESFNHWLSLLVKNRQEVIRTLDTDDRLCLG
jgi:hypothetical protein